MANFQFTTKDGQPVVLEKVDMMVCEALDVPVHPEHVHPWYNLIIEIGFAILMTQGGDTITRAMLETHILRNKDGYKPRDAVLFGLLHYFLCGHDIGGLQFKAWR